MSDIESVDSASTRKIPAKAALENALRNTVAERFRQGSTQDLTVKMVRTATEVALELPQGFFKTTGAWKKDSERIITDEFDRQGKGQVKEDNESGLSKQAQTQAKKKPAPKKRAPAVETADSNSRRKRVRLSDSGEDENSELPSDNSSIGPPRSKVRPAPRSKTILKASSKPEPKATVTAANASDQSDSNLSSAPTNGSDSEASVKRRVEMPVLEDDESELSELLDEVPKVKKQKGARTAKKPPQKKSSAKTKDKPDLGPDEAEIKRLQSWLVKCGVRKMWFRELAPYDTLGEKINHLKSLLKDVGMTGRFSEEKARQIKEEREFKADLEEIQDGAQRWGKGSGSDGEGEAVGRPKRRLAKGLQSLQSLISDQSEDSD